MTRLFDQKHQIELVDKTTPEHYLWTSVLAKAAHDALYCSDWRESRQAIEWFKAKNSNFRKVCEFAGKDHRYVYQKMIEQICDREGRMEAERREGRIYVKDDALLRRGGKIFHSHYRGVNRVRGPYKKKKKVKPVGRPRKKSLVHVLRGMKGGRGKMSLWK